MVEVYPLRLLEEMSCIDAVNYPYNVDKNLIAICRVCLIFADVLSLGVTQASRFTWAKTYGIVRLAKEGGFDISSSLISVLLRDVYLFIIFGDFG
ncbi:hypothetical protein LXA43DRAFT_996136 [Ganoderma leucocontextum]|nr:hypothetical protein LXA43DRAFT_996136 [Ganoderma leucocontextum]